MAAGSFLDNGARIKSEKTSPHTARQEFEKPIMEINAVAYKEALFRGETESQLELKIS